MLARFYAVSSKLCCLICIIGISSSISAGALELSEAIALARLHSPLVADASEGLEKARDNLVDSESLWATGINGTVAIPDMRWSAGMDVPILPQLSLGAHISGTDENSPVKGNGRVIVTPFASGATRDGHRLAYELAALDYQKTLVAIEIDAAEVYAAALKARREKVLADSEVMLSKAILAWKQELVDAGVLRMQDLEGPRLALSKAIGELAAAKRTDLRALYELSITIGQDLESVDRGLDDVLPQESIENKGAFNPDIVPLEKVLASNIDIKKAELVLASAQLFRLSDVGPELKTTLDIPLELNSEGILDWSLIVDINVSARLFSGISQRAKEREIIRLRSAFERAVLDAKQEYELALLEYELAIGILAESKEQQIVAENDLAEAEIRFGLGNISELERDQYRHSLKKVITARQSAATELLLARMRIESLIEG